MTFAKAQPANIDSLKHELAIAKEETNKVKLLFKTRVRHLRFNYHLT